MIHWPRRAAVPDGLRVYAVAPLGGRIAALDHALRRIENDAERHGAERRHVILLGGLVDGPDAAVLTLRAMRLAESPDIAILRGLAEEALLAGQSGGWGAAEHVPASVLHWLSRRPRRGFVGGYRFGDGQVTASGRVIRGDLIVLEGRRRRII